MEMPMIGSVFVVIISNYSLSVAHVDQGILEAVRRGWCLRDVVRFHFHQPSLIVHIPCVEDQFAFGIWQ